MKRVPSPAFVVVVIALVLVAASAGIAAWRISQGAHASGDNTTTGDNTVDRLKDFFGGLFGAKGVASSMVLDVIDDQGNTVATFDQSGKLAIVATSGSYSQDITAWFNTAMGAYYFKFTPKVTPTFTANGTARIDYTCTWQFVRYPKETNTDYGAVYRLASTTTAQSPLTLPYKVTQADSAPKSGTAVLLSDPNTVIITKINGMTKPPAGQSYTLEVQLQVNAKLYVNGELQNEITTPVQFCRVTISNQPAGVLSTVTVSVDVGSAYAMW